MLGGSYRDKTSAKVTSDQGPLSINKRGKGAEGVESTGFSCLLFSNVICDFSHVEGKVRGGDERKLVFFGGGSQWCSWQ